MSFHAPTNGGGGGGTIGGSLAVDQIAYGSGADVIMGDALFKRDHVTGELTMLTPLPGGVNGGFVSSPSFAPAGGAAVTAMLKGDPTSNNDSLFAIFDDSSGSGDPAVALGQASSDHLGPVIQSQFYLSGYNGFAAVGSGDGNGNGTNFQAIGAPGSYGFDINSSDNHTNFDSTITGGATGIQLEYNDLATGFSSYQYMGPTNAALVYKSDSNSFNNGISASSDYARLGEQGNTRNRMWWELQDSTSQARLHGLQGTAPASISTPVFAGSGLDDLTIDLHSSFTGGSIANFTATIDAIGETVLQFNTFDVTGTYQVGDILTDSTSGATATVVGVNYNLPASSGTFLTVESVSGTFSGGDSVTGSISGASGTLAGSYVSDTFTYTDGSISYDHVPCNGISSTSIHMKLDGVVVDFGSATGHTLGDSWTFTGTPASTAYGNMALFEGIQRRVTIGDVDGIGNGTNFRLDDAAKSIVGQANLATFVTGYQSVGPMSVAPLSITIPGSFNSVVNSNTGDMAFSGAGDLTSLGGSTESVAIGHVDGSGNVSNIQADNFGGIPTIKFESYLVGASTDGFAGSITPTGFQFAVGLNSTGIYADDPSQTMYIAAKHLQFPQLQPFANNAAAIAGGLSSGDAYLVSDVTTGSYQIQVVI